jgi:hypothetical protein
VLEPAVRRDPLFAVDRVLGPARRWLLIAVIAALNAVAFGLLPLVAGRGSSDLDVARLQVAGAAAWALVGVPTGLVIYFWLPITISKLVCELRARGLLDEPTSGDQTLDELDADIGRQIGHPAWLALGAVAILVSALTYAIESAVAGLPPVMIAFQFACTAPLVFATTVLICRLIVGTSATVTLLKRATIRVIPLDPDEAGGWSPLGHRASVLGRAAAVYGVVAIIVNVASILAGHDPLSSVVSVATLLGFIALPPIVLWAWLFTPHRAMLDAREKTIRPITEAFIAAQLAGIDPQETSPSAPAGTTGGSGRTPTDELLASGNDRLEQLRRRRGLLMEAYPTWPLRLVELRAIWATALLPFVTGIVTALTSVVTGWLKGS